VVAVVARPILVRLTVTKDTPIDALFAAPGETEESTGLRARSQEFLSAALASTQTGAWELDEDNHALHRTLAHDQIFGYDELLPEWTYERFLDHVVPEDREEVNRRFRASNETRGEWSLECRIRRQDGELRWIWAAGRHIETNPRRPRRITGIVQDITARKTTEERLRRSEARQTFLVRLGDALRPLADPIEIQTAAARVLREQLGASRVHYGETDNGGAELVVARDHFEGVPDCSGLYFLDKDYPQAAAVMRTGQPFIMDDAGADPRLTPAERASYEALPLAALVAVPLVKEGRLAALLAVHMSAPRAWTPDEVGLIAETAERTWAAVVRAQALREAQARLEEADRRKSHFLAVLSHELRNPLTPIKNSLYTLDRAPPGGDQARRARDVIARQIDLLTHLVDDLLDVTRISRGKIQLQRCRLELNELMTRTLEDHRGLFELSGLHVSFAPAPKAVHIHADWNRIAQVMSNLLLNAAKFTPRGGRVGVTVAMEAEDVLIRVSDTGTGMTPEMLAHLFEPFMQADTTLDRSKGGLGLGLALVKGLIEQHGGSVSAVSEGLGRGAELTVRLPLDLSAPPQAELPSARVLFLKRRVLMIEDNIDAADTLREVLSMNGHEVAVAYTGPDGIAKAHEHQPDVVLCDIGLPGMDGYAVARAFRADDLLKAMHLVAVSGYALPEDLQRAAQAGFERHLAKPPTVEKIETILRELPGD
jgi:PAS domain S-box-containing protein